MGYDDNLIHPSVKFVVTDKLAQQVERQDQCERIRLFSVDTLLYQLGILSNAEKK
jgi:hypothetical protein